MKSLLSKNMVLLAMAVLLILTSYIAFSSRQQEQAATELALDLQKDISHTKNKLGQTTTTVAVLEAERKELLQLSAIKDTQLANLQQLLKENPKARSASTFTASTSGTAKGKIDTVYLPAPEDSTRQLALTATIEQPDIQAKIRVQADSVYLDSYRVVTDFEYVETYTKKGLFKADELVVTIKPTNPNTIVTAAKSWHQPQPKGGLVKILTGTGIGFILGVIISAL